MPSLLSAAALSQRHDFIQLFLLWSGTTICSPPSARILPFLLAHFSIKCMLQWVCGKNNPSTGCCPGYLCAPILLKSAGEQQEGQTNPSPLSAHSLHVSWGSQEWFVWLDLLKGIFKFSSVLSCWRVTSFYKLEFSFSRPSGVMATAEIRKYYS